MLNVKRAFRDAKRLRDIIGIAFKCGLGYYIQKIKLKDSLFFHQKASGDFKKPEDLPLKLRMAMDELGGSFVKLGQLLSLRPDLIPDEYCEEFAKLQDNVTPFEYEQAREIVESELKHKLWEVFSSFDKKPIASASIGQVYRATLLNGEKVVAKVQRPDIKEKMDADIDLLYYLAELIEKHVNNKYNLKEVVEEFERYTRDELDYIKEAKNVDRFHKNFFDDKTVKTPKVYWDYTSRRVFVMSYIDGVEISDKEGLEELNCDNKLVSKNLANCFLKQVFEFGFFHADPHPANVFVLKNNRIALLDYGIVGSLNDELKEKLNKFLANLVDRNVSKLIDNFMDLGILEERNINLEKDVSDILEEYGGKEIQDINVPKLFNELISTASKHRFKLPVDFILLAKATVTCEGVGQQLDPEFNLSNTLKEYVYNTEMKKFKPSRIVKDFIESISNIRNAAKILPGQTTEILDKLKRGELKVQFEHKDLKDLEKEIDKGSNRISMGVVIAALIVASAIVLQLNKTKWMAIAGFGIALILSIMLTMDMIREGRVRI